MTDNTQKLVLKYKDEVDYPVRYGRKKTGGNHTALNIAREVSNGYFMIQLDADDEIYPNYVSFLVYEH